MTRHPERSERPCLSRAAAVLLLAAAVAPGCARTPSLSERPVILVTLDTTRADRIGAFGGTAVPTPRLDAAARDGALFEDAVSQVPMTLPSHASIFTGRYPASHGVRHNGVYRLPDEEQTLAEAFEGAGYATAAFVASFVVNRGFGLEQGFQTYDDVPLNRFLKGQALAFRAQRTADQVNAAVFEWLDNHAHGRFFLWVHYFDPHHPYKPPESPGRELKGTGYDREISYMDACFGDLVDKLRGLGLLDRAVLVVAGDHGESLGEHGEETHGVFLYEGATRVPFFIRAPGLVPSGARVPGPVELIDLAPTVLDLVGLAPLAGVQGKSLRARIEGKDDGRLAVAYAETLMPRLEYGWSELRMIRDARFKFIEAPRPELYDLRGDPAEIHDLAANEPERVGEMRSLLEGWRRETTGSTARGEASRALTAEEEATLRSLGYLGGTAFKDEPAAAGLVDPKDGIEELASLVRGRDLLADGKTAEGIDTLRDLLRHNPRNHQARTSLVDALVGAGRFAEAEDEALSALAAAEGDPDTSLALVQKGRELLASTYDAAGKRAEAEAQYERILDADPRHTGAVLGMARIALRDGHTERSRSLVGRVLETDPRNGQALAIRFQLEYGAGDREAALATAETLAEVGAGDAKTLMEAARLLLGSGRPDAAVACFEARRGVPPPPRPEFFGELGAARVAAGQLDEAREDLLTAARAAPADPRPHYLLGVIALRKNDEATARASFAAALERGPRFVAPLVALGRWYASQGRRDDAQRALREAVSRDPNDADARQALAELDRGS